MPTIYRRRPPFRGRRSRFFFGLQAANTVITVDKGDLTLTGQEIALRQTTRLAVDAGSLTLTGQSVTFATINAVVKGDLTLIGRNSSFAINHVAVDGELLLTGRNVGFTVTQDVAKGDLTLTGQNVALTPTISVVKGDLTLTGQSITLTPEAETISATLTLTGQDIALRQVTVLYVEPGQLTLTGGAIDLDTTEPVAQATLLLTGQDIALTPRIPVVPGRLTLTPHEVGLLAIGGGGSDDPRYLPRNPKLKLELIEREITVTGEDGKPRKMPLRERFAPPPPLQVAPDWLGKPLPPEITAPLDLPLPVLPDMGAVELAALDAQDLADAIAVLSAIPDPVSEQITRLLEDYRDTKDALLVLAEID